VHRSKTVTKFNRFTGGGLGGGEAERVIAWVFVLHPSAARDFLPFTRP
jgi:hypothetical protein